MSDFLNSVGLGSLFKTKDNPSSRIFISYRREDARGDAGRLTDDLKKHFGSGRVFRDIETIEPGVDFVEALNRAVGQCPVMLAIIGPHWLTSKDTDGNNRLDDPNDFIRLEIGTALARTIRVIPVLVGGAAIPKAEQLPSELRSLARRQGYELSDKRWEFDVNSLVETLEKIVGPRINARNHDFVWWKNKKVGWVGGAVVMGLIGISQVFTERSSFVPPVQPVGPAPFAPITAVTPIRYNGFDAIGRYPTIVQVYQPG